MATIVELPRLSDTMEEGVVAKWLIEVGDEVKRGQVIAEIETDKATMEFESFDSGTVLKLVAEEGETLELGAPIAVLGKEGEDPDEVLGKAGGSKSKSASKEEVDGGSKGDGEGKGKGEGDGKRKGEGDGGGESGGEASGTGTGTGTGTGKDKDKGKGKGDVHVDPESRRIAASPVARRLAREAGIELSEIEGSGPHGRIVKADVETAQSKGGGKASGRASRAAAASLSSDVDEYGRPYASRDDQPVKLTQMRKAIVRSMTKSKFSAPHFYLTIDVAMDEAAHMRTRYNAALEDAKVSYNDLVISAAAKALREHPRVNAGFVDDAIVEYGDINVGVAVAIDDGLVVPVVRHAEQKTLRAISVEVRDFGGRAKERKLQTDEMQGGTFTISNLGMFGIEQFTAVINPGEGAIMAVGGVRDEVAAVDGVPKVTKRMRVTLSCDHRVIDGAVGAQFLASFRTYLENPMRLFT